MARTSTRCVLLSLMVCGGAACSRSARVQTTQVTSADLSAAQADEAAALVRNGAFRDALLHSQQAIALSPDKPWGYYDRAVALHHLGDTDAAVAGYREAEAHFSEAERWGRSISIYGRARALDDAGRCGEARATYADFASFMRNEDPAAAEMALRYGTQCKERSAPTESHEADVAVAVVAHDYPRALELAKAGAAAGEADPWLDYNRAVALVELNRIDEAVQAFLKAESEFRGPIENRWGRSIAVYGRARALDRASRCAEAKRAYEEYAALVRNDQPNSATNALDIARQCKGRR